MNWKEETMDRLRRYPAMRNSLEAIPRELERLTEEAQGIKSMRLGVVGNRTIRARENRLLDNLVRRQELEMQLHRAGGWVEDTDDALELLTAQEQKILRRLYMEEADATAVCRELGMERSSLYRYRDEALRKLTLALYGGMES